MRVVGPLGELDLNFVLDTGTPITIVHTGRTDSLGYGAKMAKRLSRLWGTGGPQDGYVIDVMKLEVMGLVLQPFEVACHDLPEHLGIDGLLGMDLLEGRTLTVDGKGASYRSCPDRTAWRSSGPLRPVLESAT